VKNLQTAAIRSGRVIDHRSNQAVSMRAKIAEQANVLEAGSPADTGKLLLKTTE
jgi:hypothetical protein